MPVRDRGARDRFMRQASFGGGFGHLGAAPVFHHPARRTSVQDAVSLRNRRRSTLRRQVARELIAEEEEEFPGEPKYSPAESVGFERRRKTISEQVSSPISNPPADVSRLRARRQSTPIILPLQHDPEFNRSSASQPVRPLLSRRSISTDQPAQSAAALTSR